MSRIAFLSKYFWQECLLCRFEKYMTHLNDSIRTHRYLTVKNTACVNSENSTRSSGLAVLRYQSVKQFKWKDGTDVKQNEVNLVCICILKVDKCSLYHWRNKDSVLNMGQWKVVKHNTIIYLNNLYEISHTNKYLIVQIDVFYFIGNCIIIKEMHYHMEGATIHYMISLNHHKTITQCE